MKKFIDQKNRVTKTMDRETEEGREKNRITILGIKGTLLGEEGGEGGRIC